MSFSSDLSTVATLLHCERRCDHISVFNRLHGEFRVKGDGVRKAILIEKNGSQELPDINRHIGDRTDEVDDFSKFFSSFLGVAKRS